MLRALSDPPSIAAPEAAVERWPVFICYRQADGRAAASIIYQNLHDRVVPLGEAPGTGGAVKLDVYFDQRAPAVEDWTKVHEPHLARSRSFLMVCTPGGMINETKPGKIDWVHREIDWWLENRKTAPIVIDALDQGRRYVPIQIAERWPECQRVAVVPEEWATLSLDERQDFLSQILGGIVQSGTSVYREEVERERARAQDLEKALSRNRLFAWGLSILLLCSMGALAFGYHQRKEAEAAKSTAEQRLRTSLLAEAAFQCQADRLDGRSLGIQALTNAAAIRRDRDLRVPMSTCLQRSDVRPTNKTCTLDSASPPVEGRNDVVVRDDARGFLARWHDSATEDRSELFLGSDAAASLSIPSDTLKAMRIHPTKALLALNVAGEDALGPVKQRVHLVDLATQQTRQTLELDTLNSWGGYDSELLRFSTAGRVLVAASERGRVRAWRAKQPQSDQASAGASMEFDDAPLVDDTVVSNSVSSVGVSPDEELLFAVSSNSVLHIWSLITGGLIARGTVASNKGAWISDAALCLGGKTYEVSRAATRLIPRPRITREWRSIRGFAWSPLETRLVTQAEYVDGFLVANLTTSGANPASFRAIGNGPYAFLDGSESLVAGYGYGSETTFDLATGAPTTKRDIPSGARSLARTSERLLVAGTRDLASVRVLDSNRRERWRSTFRTSLVWERMLISSVARERLLFPKSAGEMLVWDVATGRETQTHVMATDVAFARGSGFAALAEDTLATEDVETHTRTRALRTGPPDSMRWSGRYLPSPDGKSLAETNQDGTISMWDLERVHQPCVIRRAGRPANESKRFSPDGGILVAADGETVSAWKTRTCEPVASSPSNARFIVFFNDGRDVFLVDDSGAYRRWNPLSNEVAATKMLQDWNSQFAQPWRLVDLDQGKKLAKFDDGELRTWSLDSGAQEPPMKIDVRDVSSIEPLAAGEIAVLTHESDLVVWDAKTWKELLTLPSARNARIGFLELSPDGKTLAFAGPQGLEIYDIAAQKRTVQRSCSSDCQCISLSIRGTVALCTGDGIDLLGTDGSLLHRYPAGKTIAVSLSADGKLLAETGTDAVVTVWDTAVHRAVVVLPPVPAIVTAVSLSPSGRWLAFGDDKGEARVLDLAAMSKQLDEIATN